MNQEKQFDFDTNWYELWTKQSRVFFETANVGLKGLFDKQSFVNPEDHLQQINAWLTLLKSQWQPESQYKEEDMQAKYWQSMQRLCVEACDKMLMEWIKRSKEKNPITNIRELYELWLHSCNDVYKKSMHSKTYQDMHGEFMNAALKFWKAAIPE